MRLFDPHIHMTSRTTDDHEAMRAAGVRAVVEPAFRPGRPRTSPESFHAPSDFLPGREPFRAAPASGCRPGFSVCPDTETDEKRTVAPLRGGE